MVSVTLPMEGIPTVLIDSYQGMRDMIAHLVQLHGYKRLAFIRGPEGHYYAQERFRAYEDALKLVPDDVRALNNLSYLYSDALNRPREGLRYARRAFQQ